LSLWQQFMEYDSTERLLYGLAALFTVWALLALILKVDKKHWFRDWAEAGFTAVWLALGIRIVLVEAFEIPSESMVPTLLIHDHLLVSKTTFGWHLPGGHGRFMKFRDVKRGEIIIFVPPSAPKQSYVKRCVGLPGDTVEVRDKRVFINGQPAELATSYGRLAKVAPTALDTLSAQGQAYVSAHLPQVKALQAAGHAQEAAQLAYQTSWLGPTVLGTGTYYLEAAPIFVRAYARLTDSAQVGEFEEYPKGYAEAKAAPGSKQPTWTADHGLGNRDWFGPYTLAADEYWMMGDNRDNSSDSRYFGPVKAEALRGTPLLRYWPLDRLGFPK
jgi:signal peptidase I